MVTDCRGVGTSAQTPEEAASFDAAFELFANYEMAAGAAVKQVLSEHPSSVMASVLRGYMMLMLETRGVQPKVAQLAAQQLDEATHANERERLHLQALARWANGEVTGAAVVWDRLLALDPHDLLALKMHHYTTFWTGRPNVLLIAVEGVIDAWDPATPGYDHVLGMHSFALNETGHHETAERIGREAVDRNAEDLWSVHAVAHALEMQGDLAGGRKLFDVEPSTWSSKNPFVGHIWWHAALFEWNAGAYDTVLRLYDERLRPASTDFFLDIQNLASLLSRLELVGVDVGQRWEELADHAEARIGDHVLTFTDVHCALALARSGRLDELDTFTASLRSHRDTRPITVDTTGIDLALQLCDSFARFARAEYIEAATSLTMIRGDLAPIGGSHAQRDLFELLALAATEVAGDNDMAAHLARARARRWPNSVPTWQRYERVLSTAGEVDAAEHAAARVKELAER